MQPLAAGRLHEALETEPGQLELEEKAATMDTTSAEKAKAAVAASQQAQRQAEVTTEALDQHSTRVVVIRERADASVRIVQQAAGADTPIPDPVRRAWLDGLGVRDNPASDTRDSPAGSPGTLPPT